MKLHGGDPFWRPEAGTSWPDPLPDRVDVVVIGAGITGALAADALSAAGRSVAVVDPRPPATGSTCASTALLLHQLDAELGQLTALIGKPHADRVYRRMAAALHGFDLLTRDCAAEVGFRRVDALYLASRQGHVRRLRGEAALQADLGLDAHWVPREELADRFGIAGHGAIHTAHAGDVDPVRLARHLLARARGRGARIVTGPTVTAIVARPDGVTVTTDRGATEALWVVSAMGYETPPGITPPVVTLHSSFALASAPLAAPGPLAGGTMLWESSRPYFYARTTTDGRLLAGGADLPFGDPARRDALLHSRTAMIERMARGWLPDVAFRVERRWCGTFAETADGVPCIGPLPGMPRVLVALCAGGNGIPFALIASEMVRTCCLGDRDPDADLFALDRPTARLGY